MRNKVDSCIIATTDSLIKLEENNRKILFLNPSRFVYKKVQIDGCTIKKGIRCDKMLLSEDEHYEYYVELKGTDVMHAIDQIEATIDKLGEFNGNRHSYIISTNVAPAYSTRIQLKQAYFKKRYNSELTIREKHLSVKLY